MALKGIVFDFDGVIVDSEPLHYRAFIDLLEPMGVSFSYEQYMAEYIGFDDRDAFRVLCEQHQIELPDDRLKELIQRKAEAFERIVARGIDPCPGAAALVEALSEDFELAICSGALRRDIDLILPAIGNGDLGERFKIIVTADDVERSKPDPAGYRMAARALNCPPNACLAIEDTPTGLEAARRAGLRRLAVAHTYPANDLKDHAERVVNSLHEASADRIRQWFDAD